MKDREWDDVVRKTREHMLAPQVGDRFTEMYSYWVHVVTRLGAAVVVQEFVGDEVKIVAYDSPAAFQKKYEYGSAGMAGKYWVHYHDTLTPEKIASYLECVGVRAETPQQEHTS